MIDNDTLLTRLHAEFGDAVTVAPEMRSGEFVLNVAGAQIADVARFLRDECEFNFLENLCGVDYLGRTPRFEVVYHLLSFAHRQRICLKVGVSESNLHVPTLTDVWQTANYQEREAFDMFGIVFDGHPSLDRILMPDDWHGHPQRKDVPLGYEEVAFTINDEQIYARKPFAQE
jgi:NADH-quinone oxidoreductase subunit C